MMINPWDNGGGNSLQPTNLERQVWPYFFRQLFAFKIGHKRLSRKLETSSGGFRCGLVLCLNFHQLEAQVEEILGCVLASTKKPPCRAVPLGNVGKWTFSEPKEIQERYGKVEGFSGWMLSTDQFLLFFSSGFSAAVTCVDFFRGLSAKKFVLIGKKRILLMESVRKVTLFFSFNATF